jgi:hypothetical protein
VDGKNNTSMDRRKLLKSVAAATAVGGGAVGNSVAAEEPTKANSKTEIEYPDCSDYSGLDCAQVPEKSWGYRDWEWTNPLNTKIKVGISHNVSYYFSGMAGGRWEHQMSLTSMSGTYDTRDGLFNDPGPISRILATDYAVEVTDPSTMEADPDLGSGDQGVFPENNGNGTVSQLFEYGVDFLGGLINPVLGGILLLDDVFQAAESVTDGFSLYDNSFAYPHRAGTDPFGEQKYWKRAGGFNSFRFKMEPDYGLEKDLNISATTEYSESVTAPTGTSAVIGSLARVNAYEESVSIEENGSLVMSEEEFAEVKDIESFSREEREAFGIVHVGETPYSPTVDGERLEYIALDLPVGCSFETITERQ